MAFQAGASTKRDNRYLVSRTELDDLAHLLGRLHERDVCHRGQWIPRGANTDLVLSANAPPMLRYMPCIVISKYSFLL
jgi:hypothetical protein